MTMMGSESSAAGLRAALAEGMVAHGKLADSIGEMQAIIDNDYEERMY